MCYIIDIIIILIFAYSVWKGHKMGFIKTLFSLIVRVVSFIVAILFAMPISQLFSDNFLSDYPQSVSQAASYTVAFIVIYLVVHIAIVIVANVLDLISKLPLLNFANKTLGIAIGAALGFVTAWIFVIALNFAFPILTSYNSELFAENTLDKSILFDLIYNVNILKPLYATIVENIF